MGKPVNPYLAKRDAKLAQQYEGQRRAQSEIGIIAMLIATHNKLEVGPGRASDLLEEYVRVKNDIAKELVNDVGDSRKKGGDGDPEFLHTKRDLALTLKSILGEEKWKYYRKFFPICKEYWDV